MAVLLPNITGTATVRAHQFARDPDGTPVPSTVTVTRGPDACSAKEQADKSWTLRLPPQWWPIRPADEVTDGSRVWVVATARIHQVPGVPDVDYVACTATLNPPEVP